MPEPHTSSQSHPCRSKDATRPVELEAYRQVSSFPAFFLRVKLCICIQIALVEAKRQVLLYARLIQRGFRTEITLDRLQHLS